MRIHATHKVARWLKAYCDGVEVESVVSVDTRKGVVYSLPLPAQIKDGHLVFKEHRGDVRLGLRDGAPAYAKTWIFSHKFRPGKCWYGKFRGHVA